MSGRQFWVLAWLTIWLSSLGIPAWAQEIRLPKDPPPQSQQAYHWEVQPPFLQADSTRFPATDRPWIAIKDPSVVRFGDRWHLFCSVRRGDGGDGRIRIAYLSFTDWDEASRQNWALLELTPGYHGAPQVFYFRPHGKWYLIYQAADPTRGLKYGPCFSTNEDLSDPSGWTLPQPLYEVAEGQKAGLDFWVICDGQKAYLFFTTLDGKMWRSATSLDEFPDGGWSPPEVALQGDIFEASHTYAVSGQKVGKPDWYLTFIEAQDGGRRYFKAYRASALDGDWQPVADSRKQPFVSPVNVTNQAESWATSYSHGELIRAGFDEKLSLGSPPWTMVFQGVNDEDRQGVDYGAIPWRLGLLKQQLEKTR